MFEINANHSDKIKNIIPFIFEKHHGAGNDFILVEESLSLKTLLTENLVNQLCDRRTGIGSDGLIRVKKLKSGHIEMIYHNSDGPIASFCGNGARCAIAFAQTRDWCNKKGVMIFKGGERSFEIVSESEIRVEFPLDQALKKWQKGSFIDTGSPHIVIEVEQGQLEKLNINQAALKIRHHDDFRSFGGTNVNYFEINSDKVSMRTFERGVENETLACGTGTIAVGMVVLDKHPTLYQKEVEIKALGGNLKVIKRDEFWLQGPVQKVFSGQLNLSPL